MSESKKDPYESITFGNSLLLRVDGAIGAMSLSPNGRDAVLAGRRGLFIIDLDDPFTTPRWLHHITSWEVADVQWSPHHGAKPSWCISTSNQKALLWDLARPSSNAILQVLHQHTRAITDINFHPWDPEVLATCSIDTFVLSWDMRTPRKPVAQWAEWRAGATQVKWNHENPYEIASSHDNSFYVWDTRKGALPVLKVNQAHQGKINGIDFSSGLSNIVTCSNDHQIKFWDLEHRNADHSSDFNYFALENIKSTNVKPTVVIKTDFPVSRARNLPFGKDKSCGIMPLIGGEDAIHIVNYDNAHKLAREEGETREILLDPVYEFQGHKGPIKDFLWRTRHEFYDHTSYDSKSKWKDFQLVTWSSQDYDLKLWPHDDDLYKCTNYNPSHQKIIDINLNDDLDSGASSTLHSPVKETFKQNKKTSYKYQTYCMEPQMTIDDLRATSDGDLLSSLTSFQIYQNHKFSSKVSYQLNHLDWISGVRIGDYRKGGPENDNILEGVGGPSNLGEEVTIVGHKFPKVRFEKISVSTGELVIGLTGPVQSLVENLDSPPLNKVEGAPITKMASSYVEDDTHKENDKKMDNQISTKANSTTHMKGGTNILNSEDFESGFKDPESVSNANELHSIDSQPSNLSSSKNVINVNATNITPTRKTNINNTMVGSVKPTPNKSIPGAKLTQTNNNMASNFPNSSKKDDEISESQILNISNDNLEKNNALRIEDQKNIDNENSLNLSQSRLGEEDSLYEPKLIFIRLKIKFPSSYPYLEALDYSKSSAKRVNKLKKSNLIDIDIEETHELTSTLKNLMLEDLNNIAYFYSNKYHRYCLEPCLRYLMGEKIDLDDDLMMDFDRPEVTDNLADDSEAIQEIGNEDWADELIKQQPEFMTSDEEDKYEFADLIPDMQDDSSISSSGDPKKDDFEAQIRDNKLEEALGNGKAQRHNSIDSVPVPKGCGALWSPCGKLVCFFMPKDSEESKPLQKFNIFKFADDSPRHVPQNYNNEVPNRKMDNASPLQETDHLKKTISFNSNSVDEDSEDETCSSESSSNDSFNIDLDEILMNDVTSRTRIPGLFKTSVGLGNRYVFNDKKGSHNRFTSYGTTTNSKSSNVGDNDNISQKKKKHKVNKNVVRVYDLQHLLPDKYDLACGYKISGETPSKLAKFNGELAAKYGYRSISETWKLLEIILDDKRSLDNGFPFQMQDPNYIQQPKLILLTSKKFEGILEPPLKAFEYNWGTHPFGKSWLLEEMVKFFEKSQNLQMIAMLSVIIFEHKGFEYLDSNFSKSQDRLLRPSNPPYFQNRNYEDFGTHKKPDQNERQLFPENFIDERNASTSLSNIRYSQGVGIDLKTSNHSFEVASVDSRGLERYDPRKRNIQVNNTLFGSPEVLSTRSLRDRLQTSSNSHAKSKLLMNNSKKRTNLAPSSKAISRISSKHKLKLIPSVHIEIKNSDKLDLFYDSPCPELIDFKQSERIKAYREQYAEMLYIWGLPIKRINMLKFNCFDENSSRTEDSDSPFDIHKCELGFRRLRLNHDQRIKPHLLASTTLNVLANKPWDRAKKNRLRHCIYCNLVVSRRIVICTNCEHVLHFECALEWWGSEADGHGEGEDVDKECPGGCGCLCLNHVI